MILAVVYSVTKITSFVSFLTGITALDAKYLKKTASQLYFNEIQIFHVFSYAMNRST
jgi:hypothetical protein